MSKSSYFQTLLFGSRAIAKPTLMGGLVGLIAGTIITGKIVDNWIKIKLPRELEKSISQIINRPIKISGIKNYSLSHLTLENCSISPSFKDSSQLQARFVTINFNPWQIIYSGQWQTVINLENLKINLSPNFEKELAKLSVNNLQSSLPLDIIFNTEKAIIQRSNKTAIALTGQLRYLEYPEVHWQYQARLQGQDLDLKLQGETFNQDLRSQISFDIKQLSLAKIQAVLPSTKFKITEKNIFSQLGLLVINRQNLASKLGINSVNLSRLNSKNKLSSNSLKIDLNVKLDRKRLLFENSQLKWGTLTAKLQGNYDWNRGFNLNSDLKIGDMGSFLKLLGIDSLLTPLKKGGDNLAISPSQSFPKKDGELAGSLVAQLKLRGTWDQPWLLGSIKSQQPLTFNQVKLQTLEAYFNSDFNRLNLPLVNLKMENGDRLLLRGYWDGQFLKQLKSQRGLQSWQKSKVEFTLQSEISPQYYLEKLVPVSLPVTFKPLLITGAINGELGNPDANLQWRSRSLPCTQLTCLVSQNKISNELILDGALRLQSQNLNLNNRILQPQKGLILVTATTNLRRSQWQLNTQLSNFNLIPYLKPLCQENKAIAKICSFKPVLKQGNINASGKFQSFLPTIDQAQSALKLQIASGQEKAEFLSFTQLQTQQITTNLSWLNLPRSLIYQDLPKQWQIKQGLVQVNLPRSALQQGKHFDFSLLKASLFNKLRLGNTLGQIQGELAANKIQINGLIPEKFVIPKSFLNLPLPVALQNTQFRFHYLLSSRTQADLLNLLKGQEAKAIKPDSFGLNYRSVGVQNTSQPKIISQLLANLTGNIQTKVILNNNKLATNVNIENQKWIANLSSPRLSLQDFLSLNAEGQQLNQSWSAIAPYFSTSLTEPNLNLLISSNLYNLIDSNKAIPIEANFLSLKNKDYQLLGKGKLLVIKSLKKPDLQRLNLSIQVKTKLVKLDFNSLLSRLPVERSLLPQNLQAQSQVNFMGNLQAQNLLTETWKKDNLQLKGKVNLNQLKVNRYAFEPQLTGQLNFALGNLLNLDLRGKRDTFATVWQPDRQNLGLFGYTPQSLHIQQQNRESIPLMIRGKADGDRFLTKLESFPLDLLELAWLSNFDIPNYLEAKVTGNLAWNWLENEAMGNLQLSPSDNFLWYKKPTITTDFTYKDSLIQLTKSSLNLDQSYAITNGSLNLRSGNLTGQINITDGQIQNITKILPSLLPSSNKTITLENIPKISENSTKISTKLNQLWQVDNQLRQAFQNSQNSLPKTLDLTGKFVAQANLTGNLRSPKLDFQLQGKRWIWQLQPTQNNLVAPLGFVLITDQVIPIESLSVKANLSPQAFNLQSQLQTTGSDISGHLALRPRASGVYLEPSSLNIKNLSLDTLQSWRKLPWDVSGKIDLDLNIAGALINPQLTGQIDLQNLAWNGQILRDNIAGKLDYQNQLFSFQTINPESIQLLATVGLPTNNFSTFPFGVEVTLNTEALALIDKLTSDRFNIEWKEGEGFLRLKTKGTFTLGNPLQLTLDPNSELQLSLVKVGLKTPLLSQLLDFNGQITLKNNYFIFEDFTSKVGNQGVTSQGKLPLFPVMNAIGNPSDPLTLTFNQTEEGDRLYQGELAGQIRVTGSALSPLIGGQISLKNGVLAVPDRLPERTIPPAISLQWFGEKQNVLNTLLLQPPQLQNLQISLENVELSQRQARPFFAFNVSGNLALDGSLSSIYSLQPTGTISVNRGSVNFAPTSVFINEHQTNQISFLPAQGLLNPTVDLSLQVYLLNLDLITLKNNAIPDDLIQSQRSQSFLLNIGIKGQAGQLLPQFSQFSRDRCLLFIENQTPFPARLTFPSTALNQYQNCLNSRTLTIESLEDLVTSPLVSITSSPPLTRSQALALFTNQYNQYAERFPQQNEQPLLQVGFSQVAATVAPGIQDVIFNTNMQFITWGNAIGLDTLQVYPTLSTQYRLDPNAVIKMDYDYGLNQGRIQYQRQF